MKILNVFEHVIFFQKFGQGKRIQGKKRGKVKKGKKGSEKGRKKENMGEGEKESEKWGEGKINNIIIRRRNIIILLY